MPPKVTDQRVCGLFTKDRKVERVANYGMEDGKLIDFVSRTTPTAGAESTFLKGMFINLLHLRSDNHPKKPQTLIDHAPHKVERTGAAT